MVRYFITSLAACRCLTSQYTAELPNRKIGQEDDCLAQIFAGQKHLAERYQEIDTLVKQHAQSWGEREAQWTQKLTQDTEWKMAIDAKLQFILDLLAQSPTLSSHPTSLSQPPPTATFDQDPPAFGHHPPIFGQPPQTFSQSPPPFGQAPPPFGQNAPSQNAAGDHSGPYCGEYLITIQLQLLLMICR